METHKKKKEKERKKTGCSWCCQVQQDKSHPAPHPLPHIMQGQRTDLEAGSSDEPSPSPRISMGRRKHLSALKMEAVLPDLTLRDSSKHNNRFQMTGSQTFTKCFPHLGHWAKQLTGNNTSFDPHSSPVGQVLYCQTYWPTEFGKRRKLAKIVQLLSGKTLTQIQLLTTALHYEERKKYKGSQHHRQEAFESDWEVREGTSQRKRGC